MPTAAHASLQYSLTIFHEILYANRLHCKTCIKQFLLIIFSNFEKYTSTLIINAIRVIVASWYTKCFIVVFHECTRRSSKWQWHNRVLSACSKQRSWAWRQITLFLSYCLHFSEVIAMTSIIVKTKVISHTYDLLITCHWAVLRRNVHTFCVILV